MRDFQSNQTRWEVPLSKALQVGILTKTMSSYLFPLVIIKKVLKVLEQACFTDTLLLLVSIPVPGWKDLSEGDITVPPSVLFCLSHCCSEGKNEEWRQARTQDASSGYVLLPCLSVERYAAVGRAMEVWINLTTAGSNCGGRRERKLETES